jgi:hypothetical protein
MFMIVRKPCPQHAKASDVFPLSWPLIAGPLMVALPNVLLGVHGGDDFEFHIPTWMDAAAQNTLLPRWAAGANLGFGDARFLFYPPLSWVIGSLLCRILPSAVAIAFYVFSCGLIASTAMFLFAREFMDRHEAMIAGMFFSMSPYFLYDIYRRAAYGEALALAFFPASVAFLVRLQKFRQSREIALFSLSVSLIWLANIPLALISSVALLVLIICLSVSKRDWHLPIYAALGALLSIGLVAFYILPLSAQMKWVNSHAIGIEVQSFRSFSVGVSTLLVATAIVHGFGAAFAFIRFRGSRVPLVVLAVLPLIMLSPLSLPFWSLPVTRYIQFPYRWLSVIAPTYGVAAGLILRARHLWITSTTLLVLACLLTAPAIIHRRTACIKYMDELREATRDGTGYEGNGDWAPLQFQLRPAMKNAPLASLVRSVENHSVDVVLWTARHKIIEVDSPEHATIRFHLAFYPLWKITTNGQPIPASADENGVLQTDLRPGMNHIEISMQTPPLQYEGILISLVSVVLLTCTARIPRRLPHSP